MIKITVELWPVGDQSKRTTLCEAEICNTGAGDSLLGQYEYRLRGKSGQMVRRGFLGEYKRQDYPVWWLVAAVMKCAWVDVEKCFSGPIQHKAVDPVKSTPVAP